MKKPQRKRVERSIRKNVTLPPTFDEARISRLLQVTGAASFSELARRAIQALEEQHGLPPMPAILGTKKKKPGR